MHLLRQQGDGGETVHLLSQRNALSLLDPVSHYVPEFGRNGKRDITIYQLLCHKAGIPTVPTAGLTTGKVVLGTHLPALLGLIAGISRHCPKLTLREQDARLAAIGMR